jgi:hypothetical protein
VCRLAEWRCWFRFLKLVWAVVEVVETSLSGFGVLLKVGSIWVRCADNVGRFLSMMNGGRQKAYISMC